MSVGPAILSSLPNWRWQRVRISDGLTFIEFSNDQILWTVILTPDSKKCSRCKEQKSLEMFYNCKNSPKGKHHRCKECAKKLPQTFSPDQLERRRKTSAAWYRKNKNNLLPKMRSSSLKNNYGITDVEYEKILEGQGRVCKICGSDNPGRGKYFCVDHCHKTGKVRGLLCDNCNKGLGHFKDNISFLERAMTYVRSCQ